MQPGNPIVGGTVLRIPALQSPDYVAGVSGWAVFQNGHAEFNDITVRGTVVVGNGTTNTIIFDDTRNAMFVYDQNGHLVMSLAPTAGTDSFGNAYKSGFTSYFGSNILQSGQLDAGIARFTNGNSANVGGTVQETQGNGPASNQPGLELNSGHNASHGVRLQLNGDNATQTAAPFITSFPDGFTTDIDWVHTGAVKYGDPSTLAAETWHALPLAANWANTGSPWANGSYMRTNDNRVNLGGVIQWNAAASNAPVQITTALPAAYRPISQHRLIDINMPANTATATVEGIDVHTDGTLWITGFANGTGPMSPITLTGLSYPLDL